ncbi:2-succinyl-6-hydroxy-2,4-cyclohexadiene-1-carboxylate synthase [Ureibacillus xyleni]|uniref:Putative 2-succinyl-6-hydroxy-2,4-cyclohexadiene-1-carboxylate synthase n=1 Tax=Ureibacillus xyleni TaxID=614648 RepID=A0A285S7X9_9BACL|nr:2-succinyl-6-hydroxy-2,4-cyclohexadiene-1-carboxylate synthase [Ureibacillus xyleni]SOC03512.1 2-succinyl-6-hydroxy-2,4-cyclohexadiene-1-carboxylate synthase [Ureibacillus xyleni]
MIVRGININFRRWNEMAKETIVLLHGFTGSVATWEKVARLIPENYHIVAVDLIGHGLSEAPTNLSLYSMEEQVEVLHELFKELQLSNFTLLGYSLGGRVALSYVAKYPSEIKQLILESASPGLKTEQEREARRISDEKLADEILQNGLQAFVEKWGNIPLFQSQKNLPEEERKKIREERLSQTEIGLANSLRGMGTGAQNSLWTSLSIITKPVTLITGSIDEKFCKIAHQMKELLPNADHIEIRDVGHAIHVENPTLFATIVEDVLKK